jgi:hypothetical protein
MSASNGIFDGFVEAKNSFVEAKRKLYKRNDEMLDHWIAPVEGFSFPPSEFYATVEKEMARLKIPGMRISQKLFHEGGILSDKRLYLRLLRERLAFDICAAPFGSGYYFFSCRMMRLMPIIKLWHIAVVAFFFGTIYALLIQFLEPKFAMIALAGLFLAIGQILRNPIALGLSDLDLTLLNIPVIAPFYEILFRKFSYYRHDMEIMYLQTIPQIIKRLAEEVTGGQGIRLERQYQYSPVLGNLYKPVSAPHMPK